MPQYVTLPPDNLLAFYPTTEHPAALQTCKEHALIETEPCQNIMRATAGGRWNICSACRAKYPRNTKATAQIHHARGSTALPSGSDFPARRICCISTHQLLWAWSH